MVLRGLVFDYGGVLTDYGDEVIGEPPLIKVLRVARGHGLRTGLLSNADGHWSPPRPWQPLFDAVVVSGEVGLGKPDREIYLLTAKKLGLAPQECVFVDDLAVNVRGAVAAGMVGVHHQSVRSTLEELEILLAITLAE